MLFQKNAFAGQKQTAAFFRSSSTALEMIT
jgi:hypothetical protein